MSFISWYAVPTASLGYSNSGRSENLEAVSSERDKGPRGTGWGARALTKYESHIYYCCYSDRGGIRLSCLQREQARGKRLSWLAIALASLQCTADDLRRRY